VKDALKGYLALAGGLTEVTRQKAQAAARALVAQGEATAGQVTSLADDLVAQSRSNREAVAALVKYEVDRALGLVGLASNDEVSELTARVRNLESSSRELARAAAAGPATSPPGRAPASKAATRAPARAATASKAAKAPASKAATRGPAKSGAAKAPASKAAKAPSGRAAKTTGGRAAKPPASRAATTGGKATTRTPAKAGAATATNRAAKAPANKPPGKKVAKAAATAPAANAATASPPPKQS